jgi:hypothetical protein
MLNRSRSFLKNNQYFAPVSITMESFSGPPRTNTLSLAQRYTRRCSTDDNLQNITVYERDEARGFSNEGDLCYYLLQFPEAPNDDASRLFVYYPDCRKELKVALFDKQEFQRFAFSGIPNVAIRQLTQPPLACRCTVCQNGGYCGHHVLVYSAFFWRLEGSQIDTENRLEVKDSGDVVDIFASGSSVILFPFDPFPFPATAITCLI